jgi:hypothetical protein
MNRPGKPDRGDNSLVLIFEALYIIETYFIQRLGAGTMSEC